MEATCLNLNDSRNNKDTETDLAESNSDDGGGGSAGSAPRDDGGDGGHGGIEQLGQKLKKRYARLRGQFVKEWNRHKLVISTSSFYHPMLCGTCTDRDQKKWGKCTELVDHSDMATESAGCAGAALRSARYRIAFERDYHQCVCNDCVETNANHKFPCDKWVLSRDTPEGERVARQWAEQLQALQQQQQQQEALQQEQQETQRTLARSAEQDRVFAMVKAKYDVVGEDSDDVDSGGGQ